MQHFNYISCHVVTQLFSVVDVTEVPAKVVKAQYDAGILPFTVEAA